MMVSTSFPEPLDKNTQNELLRKYKDTNKTSSENRTILIERNLRLVAYIAKSFENIQRLSFEDIVSIGIVGLINAIDTYDPTRKVEFATYASRCIKNQILMHLRSLKYYNNLCSLDEPLTQDNDGNELYLMDILYDEKACISLDYLIQSEQYNVLEKAINSLCPRYRLIIYYHYYEYLTFEKIGAKLKLSRSYVSMLHNKALKELKDYLEKFK